MRGNSVLVAVACLTSLSSYSQERVVSFDDRVTEQEAIERVLHGYLLWPKDNKSAKPSLGHTAVWTGSAMIVWGGRDSAFQTFDTGGMYDPILDAWASTPTSAPCPGSRWLHVAVWTGSEMIVWGGGYNTDGRFDPAAGTWSATSTGTGCPLARLRNAVVWTGSEMIVWGGAWAGWGSRRTMAADTTRRRTRGRRRRLAQAAPRRGTTPAPCGLAPR